MITTAGKTHIKRFLAGYVSAIGQSIAFGIGGASEALSDYALQLEVASAPINMTYYDFANNRLVFKASVPEDYVGKIYEIGVYSTATNPITADYASRLISTFDSATENWIDINTSAFAPFASTNTRVGDDSLRLTPAANATSTYALQNVSLDLSGYSAADILVFAYNVGNANTSTLRIRFMTDNANYFDFDLGSQTAGYKFTQRTVGSATVTGAPTWSNITQIQVTAISGSGGASAIDFDAIRILDIDSPQTDYVLVARKVLATPVTSVAGMPQDIEFTLDVSV